MTNYFLVELELGDRFADNFDANTFQMNQLLADGKIQTYGVSQDWSRMWLSVLAGSELQVWDMVDNLPVEAVSEPIITALHTYNQSLDLQFPAVSLN